MRASRLLGAFVMVAACGCATRVIEIPPESSEKAARDAITLAEVRALGSPGDWLVIRGYHASDNLVAALTNKPFSHAAVLDLERDQVVEAEAPGVHSSTLAKFVAKAHRLLLIRPVWSNATAGGEAVLRARSFIGRPYDFLGLIGVDVPDRYYCSELVLEAWRPAVRASDVVPRPIEPGQLHHYGRILFDNGPL